MSWSILIPCGSLTLAIIAQILLSSRSQKKESEERGREMGKIAESLEDIKKDMQEMKAEQKAMSDRYEKQQEKFDKLREEDMRQYEELVERIALTEASTKSAHKRIDEITGTNRG